MKKKICWLTMGGTIAMTKDEKSGALIPAFSAKELLKSVPEIEDICDIEMIDIINIDSTNIQPKHWCDLVQKISEVYEKFDGFVVTHGTDTLAYSASAVSFMIEDLGKPIIFTASQLPLTNTITDARNNLAQSFAFACEDIGEVGICFAGKLYRGNRTKKESEFSLNAFCSPNILPIGEMGIRISLEEHRIRRDDKKIPEFHPDFEENISMIHLHPGICPDVLDFYLEEKKVRGIIINAFGAGNIPNLECKSFLPVLLKAKEMKIPVVVTTQCDLGAAEMFLYETGMSAQQIDLISGNDMTTEAAFTKLGVILAREKSPETIRAFMEKNVAGELTEHVMR